MWYVHIVEVGGTFHQGIRPYRFRLNRCHGELKVLYNYRLKVTSKIEIEIDKAMECISSKVGRKY